MSLSVARRLRQLLGLKKGLHSDADLLCYSFDATPLLSHKPDAVVLPDSKNDIALILAFADRKITSNPACFKLLQYGSKRWNKARFLSHISQVLRLSLGHSEA